MIHLGGGLRLGSRLATAGYTNPGGRNVLPGVWGELVVARGRQGLPSPLYTGGEAEDRDQLYSQSHKASIQQGEGFHPGLTLSSVLSTLPQLPGNCWRAVILFCSWEVDGG